MNVMRTEDRLLIVGLAIALLVAFSRSVQRLLVLADYAQRASGLLIAPAFLIVFATLLYYRRRKRRRAEEDATLAHAAAQQAEARATEMKRLVEFGQSLARATDLGEVREAIQQRLSPLAGSDQTCVFQKVDGTWQEFAGALSLARRSIEQACDRVVAAAGSSASGTQDPLTADGAVWLPIAAAGEMIGVLSVVEPEIGVRQRTLAAAAALIGIALRNVYLAREVRDHSVRDRLTGCFTRPYAMQVIDSELRRARRSHSPVSIIIFDLDRFKTVNDTHGVEGGDAVLAAVGVRMRNVLRSSDLKCRYAGEKFLVVLPDTPIDGAHRVADSLRRELAATTVNWKGELIRVTASFGVTTALTSEISTEALIARADAALYRAKDQGRDCVRVSVEAAVA